MKKLIMIIAAFLLILFTATPLYAADTIQGPDVIYKQKTSLVTMNDILSLYSSYGNMITVEVDGYTGNGATVGTYTVDLVATDGLNDTGFKTIEVRVVETFGNNKINVITDNGNLYVKSDVGLTHKEIIEALATVDLIYYSSLTSSAYLIRDDYSEKYQTPGYYPFHFRIIDTSGFDKTYQLFIYVTEAGSLSHGAIDMNGPDEFGQFISTWVIPGVILVAAYWIIKKIFFKKTNTIIKPY